MSMPEAGSSDGEARLRVVVRGRVQRVLFRTFTRNRARRLGLAGWVRNLPDGRTVEVVAEGRRSALEQLLAHLREGPPGAYVTQVEVEWDTPRGEVRPFEVH